MHGVISGHLLARLCRDCTLPAAGRAMRCEPCGIIRLRAHRAAYAKKHPERIKAARERDRAKSLARVQKHYRTAKGRANRDRFNAKQKLRRAAAKRALVKARPAPAAPTTSPLLLAVGALVPRSHPARDDVMGAILLAIVEGETTAEMLAHDGKALGRFLAAGYRDNFEQRGYAVSLSQPRRDGGSWDDVLEGGL